MAASDLLVIVHTVNTQPDPLQNCSRSLLQAAGGGRRAACQAAAARQLRPSTT